MKFQNLNGKEYIKYSYLVKNRGECIDYIGQNKYKTNYNIVYWIDYNLQNEYIIIPKGYEFDFNSVPCFGTCIVGKDEFMIALIHDILYDLAGKITIISKHIESNKFEEIKSGFGYNEETGEFLYNRKMADKIWLNGAIEEKKNIERVDVSKRAYLGYIALRIGGRNSFKHNK